MPPADLPRLPPRRRWPRVSLRGLMILIAVVAAPAGWLANKIQSQRRAIAAVRAVNGWPHYDYQDDYVHDKARNMTSPRTEPAAPAWLRRGLGDELFQEVREVAFTGRLDAPAALAAVAAFDRLGRLVVVNATRVDGALGDLRGLTRLRTVRLGGRGVDDAALGDLAGLVSTRELTLRDTGATDAGFARLATLPAVTDLTIGRNPGLTDAGLARLLAGLPQLRRFKLDDAARSCPLALAALAEHHPDLLLLNLAWSGARDADLAPVGRITGLAELNLKGTALTAAGLAHLAPLARLARLTLAEITGLDDDALGPVGRIAALEDLDLGTTYVGDAGLPLLAPLARLKSLNLTATDVTDAGLAALIRLPALKTVDLNGNPQITDAGLAIIARSPTVHWVNLGPTGTTQAGRMAFLTSGSKMGFGQSFGAVKRLPPRTPPRPGS